MFSENSGSCKSFCNCIMLNFRSLFSNSKSKIASTGYHLRAATSSQCLHTPNANKSQHLFSPRYSHLASSFSKSPPRHISRVPTSRTFCTASSERESIDYDVVIVGAGPAGLSAAIRLKQMCRERNADLTVCVLDKGAEVGE